MLWIPLFINFLLALLFFTIGNKDKNEDAKMGVFVIGMLNTVAMVGGIVVAYNVGGLGF